MIKKQNLNQDISKNVTVALDKKKQINDENHIIPSETHYTLQQRFIRGEVFAQDCPSRTILTHVTSRWGVLVLLALLIKGTQRFNALKRQIGGVSDKMLAQTLQTLEADGFIQRIEYPVIPPHVEYTLTDLGEQVAKHIEQLTDWIESNLSTILASQAAGT